MVSSNSETELLLIYDQGKPFRLNKHRTATVGREKYNDIILNNLLVSRQHALVTWENGEFIVKDLKSQNGTFVNDKRIEKEVLQQGDVIKIGGFELHVQAVSQNAIEEMLFSERLRTSSKETVKYSVKGMKVSEDGFSGNLTSLSLAEIVQIINQSLKNGRLTIFQEAEQGIHADIYFHDGEFVHAQFKKISGLEAVFAILRLKEGKFEFKNGVIAPEKTIHESAMKILLEAHRLMDEEKR
ncbi:DUF4388 domain-containing protein [candidate division CSSED10-310 bacterium]|uniref:DUF4388 domain-containing protein n=1 Tax=candidate division CSSED10-310 bacterium TaxID=2855610 RepID=A0ABV6YRE1_UNCC1